MAKATIEQLQQAHDAGTDMNRDEGVVQYKTSERLSDEVYEVQEGKHHLPGGTTIGPGHRFHPTERQVKSGSLRGKARPLSAREMREVKSTRPLFAGADFDEMERNAREAEAREQQQKLQDAAVAAAESDAFAALPMADGTRALASAAGLVAADFDDVLPTGQDGQYTRRQIEEMIAAKKAAASS